MKTIEALREEISVAPLCLALSVPRASVYRRWSRPKVRVPRPRSRHPRALTPIEREQVAEVLYSERFCDLSPAENGSEESWRTNFPASILSLYFCASSGEKSISVEYRFCSGIERSLTRTSKRHFPTSDPKQIAEDMKKNTQKVERNLTTLEGCAPFVVMGLLYQPGLRPSFAVLVGLRAKR